MSIYIYNDLHRLEKNPPKLFGGFFFSQNKLFLSLQYFNN